MTTLKRWTFAGAMVLGSVLGWAPQTPACESLGIMGYPESCQVACRYGWNSAYANTTCMIDILIGW